MPKVEFKRKSLLSRQEVGERLLEWGNALVAGSEVELESGGDSLKIAVADEIEWELEIEIDGSETEIEIELKWRDRPARPARPAVEPPPAAAKSEPEVEAEPASTPPAARRGRPRKPATS